MILSSDQLQSLELGESILIKIDNKECVVVPKDVFERMQETFVATPRETYAAVLQAIDTDEDDTDQYLDYLNES
jgi:hypothetical protein